MTDEERVWHRTYVKLINRLVIHADVLAQIKRFARMLTQDELEMIYQNLSIPNYETINKLIYIDLVVRKDKYDKEDPDRFKKPIPTGQVINRRKDVGSV